MSTIIPTDLNQNPPRGSWKEEVKMWKKIARRTTMDDALCNYLAHKKNTDKTYI